MQNAELLAVSGGEERDERGETREERGETRVESGERREEKRETREERVTIIFLRFWLTYTDTESEECTVIVQIFVIFCTALVQFLYLCKRKPIFSDYGCIADRVYGRTTETDSFSVPPLYVRPSELDIKNVRTGRAARCGQVNNGSAVYQRAQE